MKEYKLVPQADIDAIEEARKDLCRYLSYAAQYGDKVTGRFIQPMHKLTHTKYRTGTDMEEQSQVTGD